MESGEFHYRTKSRKLHHWKLLVSPLDLLVDELNTQFKSAFNSEPESPAMCGYDISYVPDNLDNWLPFVDEQWTYLCTVKPFGCIQIL